MQWLDFVDIGIIAFILYRLLLLLIDTRGMQLVKGMLVLAVVAIAARALDLQALSWLVGKATNVLLIAIPIIFQPEFRRILEELGRGNLWRNAKARKEAEGLADEVARALLYLKNQRIGALLVLQRDTGLKDIWRSGVQLNSEISQEMLVSIFWHGNPLHDGAAIIDRDHILAAACYLPLTDKTNLSRWFGTRHRAALGVTEHSDALALVVSEERGEISLAVKGHLSRELKDPQVRKLLQHFFEGEEERTFFDRIGERFRSLRGEGEKREDSEAS